MNKIIERIERKTGIPDLSSILATQLSPTDLQSLLLEVYRIRSSQIQPSDVLSDFESNRFVRPSAVSPLSLLQWEQVAFSHLSQGFEPLALECAIRRRGLLRANPKSPDSVHLATSHRLIRAQHYKDPKSIAHFSAFALCSAGRDQGNLQFEILTLGVHIRFYLTALQAFLGPRIPLHVSLTDLNPNPRRTY